VPDFFAQPVVCNTGPLLGLSRVAKLDLLARLFPQVLIPREVADEITQAPHPDVAALARELSRFTVLQAAVAPEPLLLAELDRGEAAVIATAAARGLSRVIMDERKGRRIASLVYGFQVKGTGGLLVAAKQRKLITAVRPLLEVMKAKGYFLSTRLMEECLRRAGESAATTGNL
jgi:predicted nucleic acid-binding protein